MIIDSGHLLQGYLLLLGIVILVMAIFSLARKRMAEPFCLTWGMLALIAIVMGIFTDPMEIERYLSYGTILLALLGVSGIISVWWFACIQISLLMRRNRELAMQVALLNQENEQLIRAIQKLSGESHEERSTQKDEKDAHRDQHYGIWRSRKSTSVTAE